MKFKVVNVYIMYPIKKKKCLHNVVPFFMMFLKLYHPPGFRKLLILAFVVAEFETEKGF